MNAEVQVPTRASIDKEADFTVGFVLAAIIIVVIVGIYGVLNTKA